MQHRHYIVVGGALLILASGLTAIGQHDGVLGMTPKESLPAPGDGPSPVTIRVIVEGVLEKDHAARSVLDPSGEATLVRARLDGTPTTTLLVVVLKGEAPAPGTVLIVQGSMETIFARQANGGVAVLRLDAQDVREPILFKKT